MHAEFGIECWTFSALLTTLNSQRPEQNYAMGRNFSDHRTELMSSVSAAFAKHVAAGRR